MTPIAVQAQDVLRWVPLIGWHLASFCENGASTPEQLVNQIASRDRQLWIAWDGRVRAVVLTEVLGDNLNSVRVTHAAGDGKDDWLHLWGTIEAWARERGAKRIIAEARPGWERVLTGMKKTHVILEKRL